MSRSNAQEQCEVFDLFIEWHNGKRRFMQVEGGQIRLTRNRRGYIADGDVIYPTDICTIRQV